LYIYVNTTNTHCLNLTLYCLSLWLLTVGQDVGGGCVVVVRLPSAGMGSGNMDHFLQQNAEKSMSPAIYIYIYIYLAI